MWIFFSNAFVALSKHKTLPDHFMVRARLRGDIESAFPGLKIEVKESEADGDQYRFSAAIRATDVIVAVNDRLERLGTEYARQDLPLGPRDAAYGNVWLAMRAAQSREAARESWSESLGAKFPSLPNQQGDSRVPS